MPQSEGVEWLRQSESFAMIGKKQRAREEQNSSRAGKKKTGGVLVRRRTDEGTVLVLPNVSRGERSNYPFKEPKLHQDRYLKVLQLDDFHVGLRLDGTVHRQTDVLHPIGLADHANEHRL